jgi:serine protease AprX
MTSMLPTRWRRVAAGLALILAWATSASTAPARPHRSQHKVSPKAWRDAETKGRTKLDVIVRFRRSPGSPESSFVGGIGGQVRRHHRSRWMTVRLPGNAVAALADNPAVEYVAVDAPISAAMDVARKAGGKPTTSQPESWLKGSGVTIAMVDSGVAAHPELQTLVAAVDFVGAYDPLFAPLGSIDANGHGTHVAGIMIGNGTHSYGKKYVGIAPEASLVSLRVLDGAGRGQTSGMLSALQWVLEHKDQYGIRVLNLSLGHPVYEPANADPLVQAVEELWDAGIVVVCSAGNAGHDGHGTISSPCNSRKVITVGALNDRNTLDTWDDTVATFSSLGPTRIDLVAKPDLIAPGNRIVSARAPGSHLDLIAPERRVLGNGGYIREHFEMSGTSMAAPMVSGTVALMLEQDPLLNPGTVKARLMRSARKVSTGDPFASGAGVLDILAALRASGEVADAPSPRVFPDSATGHLGVENTAVLWGNPAFPLSDAWSSAVIWPEATLWSQSVVLSNGILWPEGLEGSSLLWPELAAVSTLWPESTLWSEAVLWPELPLEEILGSLGELFDDP